MSVIETIKGISKRWSAIHHIVTYYLLTVIFSTIIVSLPIFHRSGVDLSFIDAMFTAVTSISVTGLTVVSIPDTFNPAGQIALAVLLHLGGVGIMTMGTFIWVVLGKKIGIRSRKLIMVDQNTKTLAGLVRLMLEIFKLILIIELIGAIILSIHYMNYFDTVNEALLQGVFGAISATTNGGLDITGASLIPFADDYFVQFIHMILIVLGAIGFPVLIEVQEVLRGRAYSYNDRHKFSLFTKITTITFFWLVVFGTIFILLLEKDAFFADKSWHESFFYSLFQSVTSRSGGLSTMDVSEFSLSTLFLISALMFIGASPSSVGGGIRTTTFAIMLLTIWNYAKGNTSIKVFGREIDQQDMLRSFIVIVTGMMLCIGSVIVLMKTESFALIEVIFEVSSAFGTTGLSMGITPELSTFGKGLIMCLMFIGRIGIFSFLFLIRGDANRDKYRYPTERIIIG
ncbi:Trk-type K+ transport system, membrane component [Gracilibacillus halophilus YIM-C55.5]|uniref:Trk-type K+ transport system, membrane component n=1 Tax=Gracilibacillus halophilus YIM-C55.5 TaxID=1308866 RepID=N4WQL7_9BACI|nr:TrkH family potassium uptake protein [Gracilibacillus halophilus]ENH96750.1 Trk-type K+ transport system, membrane component [Gracilibacillus halophilus YIM-C55.5]